ncbi:histone-arginine methyltransferase METTL23-like isoform X3 [Tubulanus polymorphus]|uniref:histone-arginine methyltransferase METTL23-like isoform X3 n=1 Tax=Tubulanus polymorphus TaxID=672921 RepID=UPI003DA5F843
MIFAILFPCKKLTDQQYGSYVWPSAPLLGQFLWFNRQKVHNKSIVELGCGSSLPGIVALRCGGLLKLSDGKAFSYARKNAQDSCELNNILDIPVLSITWGIFHPDILNIGAVDIILGSDCFYDTKDFEDILVTVSYILEENPSAEFWTTYQERSADRNITQLLHKWNLKCTHIPIEDFYWDFNRNVPSLQMLVITKSDVLEN